MRVLDPGHRYELNILDGINENTHPLQFVKRLGEHYPGNITTSPGVTIQEVLRACIDRLYYVNNQIRCPESEAAIYNLRMAIYNLEVRAKRVKKKTLNITTIKEIETISTCITCGHIMCTENHSHTVAEKFYER